MFADEIERNRWIGIDDNQETEYTLHAGRLRMDFVSGRVINISLNGQNVVDEIYFALRDCNWGTIPYLVENLVVKQEEDEFSVTFNAVHNQNGMYFTWQGHISGTADDKVTYSFDGIARSDFMRNRIGFCVLHPAVCAGVKCDIEHASGQIEEGCFPVCISPHQPYKDITSITHYPREGVTVCTEFEGDVFEMEDQRNWTDASFKTYCTPLELPFPASVKSGDRFCQSITVSVKSEMDFTRSMQPEIEQLSPVQGVARTGSGFSLGSCITKPLTKRQMQRVKTLALSHIRYDYHFKKEFEELIFEQARELGLKVIVAAFFTDDWQNELIFLHDIAATHKQAILGIAVFRQETKVVSQEILQSARETLDGLNIPIGSGTDAFFTQINRERLPESLMDFVTYSNNPQVHAFDNASIMSTVRGQAANLESCAALYQNLPKWVSPVSLKMRWNPDATAKEALKSGQIPRDVDARQMSLFAASWFLRSAAVCIGSGAAGASFFELVGCKGIMEEECLNRDFSFPSYSDMLFPLYYAFFALRDLSAFDITTKITDRITAIILRNTQQLRVILANPTSETVTVELSDMPVSMKGLMINEDNAAEMAERKEFSTDDFAWKNYNLNGALELKRYSIFIAEL